MFVLQEEGQFSFRKAHKWTSEKQIVFHYIKTRNPEEN
jgi:hypothetical protein